MLVFLLFRIRHREISFWGENMIKGQKRLKKGGKGENINLEEFCTNLEKICIFPQTVRHLLVKK